MEHSEAASVSTGALVLCKSTRRKACDHKQRKENRRGGRRNLVNTCNEDEGCHVIDRQGSLIFQERMSVLDEQRKPQIILKTSDDDTAYRFLAKLNPQRTLNGLQLGALTDEQTGAVVRELCSNNLSVYRVEEHRESLEDIFLTLTGKELTL